MEEINTLTPEQTTAEVVDIQFRPGQKVYYFDPNGITCVTGDHVIIDTARGPEYGICAAGNHEIPSRDVVAPLRPVIRLATAQDKRILEENRAKEKRAYEVCLQKIGDHGLDMQLVSAEYAFDGSKILFFFTADDRVDFRELVKNLASVFHTRIELRQIGVRDKAKMVGGLGICGRPFCCSSFLEDFQPVSIKMAKTQNLSLNPTKISGTCGRLMCCLNYEQAAYEDLIRTSPKVESFIDTPEGRGTVIELDLLRQRVKVRMEEHPETVSVFSNDEIAVLRSGKAKKNDPPIPADLAPISGAGKRVRKETVDTPVLLDPIRFRYSTEPVVAEEIHEEPQEPAAPAKSRRGKNRKPKEQPAEQPKEQVKEPVKEPAKEQPKEQPKEQEHKKRHRSRKPQEPKEPKEQPAAQAKNPVEAPVQEAPAGESGEKTAKKPYRRRPNYHRRKKPAGDSNA